MGKLTSKGNSNSNRKSGSEFATLNEPSKKDEPSKKAPIEEKPHESAPISIVDKPEAKPAPEAPKEPLPEQKPISSAPKPEGKPEPKPVEAKADIVPIHIVPEEPKKTSKKSKKKEDENPYPENDPDLESEDYDETVDEIEEEDEIAEEPSKPKTPPIDPTPFGFKKTLTAEWRGNYVVLGKDKEYYDTDGLDLYKELDDQLYALYEFNGIKYVFSRFLNTIAKK